MKAIFTHWKTTGIGLVLGGLLAVTGQPDTKHFAIAFFTALLGIAAKDWNVA